MNYAHTAVLRPLAIIVGAITILAALALMAASQTAQPGQDLHAAKAYNSFCLENAASGCVLAR